MTTINIRKVTIINRGLTSVIIVICFLFSLIQSQETHAEMKKVSGTSGAIVKLAQNYIALSDVPVKGFMRVYHSVLSSADPHWNNANFFYIEYAESIKEWSHRGYGVITHPGGDQSFIKFVSKDVSVSGAESTREWDGSFIGGTGKFKDIRARWLLKLKFTMAKGGTAEWKVEYF